jgi:hypothetical protein
VLVVAMKLLCARDNVFPCKFLKLVAKIVEWDYCNKLCILIW